VRSAQTLKIDVQNLHIHVDARYRRAGSIMAGTASAGGESVRLDVEFESDAPVDQLTELVRVSERSCYTAGALREPVSVELGAVVNGQRLEIPT
jgi:hypothetical protein